MKPFVFKLAILTSFLVHLTVIIIYYWIFQKLRTKKESIIQTVIYFEEYKNPPKQKKRTSQKIKPPPANSSKQLKDLPKILEKQNYLKANSLSALETSTKKSVDQTISKVDSRMFKNKGIDVDPTSDQGGVNQKIVTNILKKKLAENAYNQHIYQKVFSNFMNPLPNQPYEIIVEITIDSEGNVEKFIFEKNSNIALLNAAVEKSIKNAQPFDLFPESFDPKKNYSVKLRYTSEE